MSHSTTDFTPVSEPALVPELVSQLTAVAAERLVDVFTREQLDTAVDRAAKASRSIVAVFAAAPVETPGRADGAAAAEFTVEYFVPPACPDLFHRELEGQLLQASPRYVTGRYRGDFAPCVVHAVSPGTFHQYRVTWRASKSDQSRWSRDRRFIDGVLRQSSTGWRESGAA